MSSTKPKTLSKRKKNNDNNELVVKDDSRLCKGVSIDDDFYAQCENRIFTLILKGIIVFLLSFGSIGCYLSSLKIEYNVLITAIILLPVAIICALLYYRLMAENLGYLVIFGIFILLVFMFTDYINSGFYAIVNITINEASLYFDVEGMQSYNERIANRYVTVTCVVIFIGMVLNILLNVYISRRMQHIIIIPITMGALFFPLYLELEPNIFYVILLLSGIAITYVLKQGRHYGIKRSDEKFSVNKKGDLIYNHSVKSLIGTFTLVFIIVTIIVFGVNIFVPARTFKTKHLTSQAKLNTMEKAADVVMLGLEGLFKDGQSSGGMNGGVLGEASSIKPDNEVDLRVEFSPYSTDTVYIRSYVGVEYRPYENKWDTYDEDSDYDLLNEYNALSGKYKDDNSTGSRGIMNIENIDATSKYKYYPYYIESYPQSMYKGLIEKYEYYPRLTNDIQVKELDSEELEQFLFVPEHIYGVLSDFCYDNNIKGSSDEIIQNIDIYFEENIPYTLKPGRTPKNEDFITYFLEENKKGYCTHFSSAAVMLFRYNGIPARYVEGYAISYEDILQNEIIVDKYSDKFYSGYSEFEEIGVVNVFVTDASAHAWVEVYIEGKGWVVVDPTPSTLDDELDDFWSKFDDSEDAVDVNQNNTVAASIMNFRLSDNQLKMILIIVLVVSFLVVGIVGVKRIIEWIKGTINYFFSNLNDKLIIRYSIFYKKKSKKLSGFSNCKNYNTQIEYLDNRKYDEVLLENILQKAGFSKEQITKKEYKYVLKWIKSQKYKK